MQANRTSCRPQTSLIMMMTSQQSAKGCWISRVSSQVMHEETNMKISNVRPERGIYHFTQKVLRPRPTISLKTKEWWTGNVCHKLVAQGQVLPHSPWSPTSMVLHIDSNLRHCESTSRSRSRLGVQKKYCKLTKTYMAFTQKFEELKRLSSLWSEEGHVIDVRIIAKHFD